jgi:hypothetical protein
MHERKQIILSAFLFLWLGCAGMAQAQFDQIRFDATANSSIKKIDVLEVVQQQRLMLLAQEFHIKGAPSKGAQSAIGNVKADQDAMMAASEKLKQGFARRNGSLSSEFAKQLVSAIQAKGYDVKTLNGKQPKANSIGLGMDYTNIQTNADAILHVVIRFAGYKDDPSSSGLIPMVGIDAYLFNTKEKKIVYRQVFNQGYKLINSSEVEYLPLGQEIKFPNKDAFFLKIDSAVDGLVQATQPVALRIADQLTR